MHDCSAVHVRGDDEGVDGIIDTDGQAGSPTKYPNRQHIIKLRASNWLKKRFYFLLVPLSILTELLYNSYICEKPAVASPRVLWLHMDC